MSLGHEPADLLGMEQNKLYTGTLEARLQSSNKEPMYGLLRPPQLLAVRSPHLQLPVSQTAPDTEIDFPIGLAMVSHCGVDSFFQAV